MDCFCGKKMSRQCVVKGNVRGGKGVWVLQEEMKALMYEREKECKAFDRDMMVFAFKEAEWKQEKKRLKEEVKKLRKVVEEKEEKIKGMEDFGFFKDYNKLDKDRQQPPMTRTTTTTTTSTATATANSFLVEQMREERALRDEAVDKWKKLYLAIKTELDDLIQRTHRDGLYWKAAEEEMIEELRMEIKSKDKSIEELKARLASKEHEEYKKAREIDILRQSLRIMSSRKGTSFVLSKPKLALLRQAT